jgi:hypothetical protein
MYFFDEVQLPPFSVSTVVKTWSLADYKEFALHCWFQGTAGARVQVNIYFNQIAISGDTITLSPAGLFVLTKVYPVYAPNLSIVLSNPSASIQAKVRVYAGCCPDPPRFFSFLFGKREQSRILATDLSLLDQEKH